MKYILLILLIFSFTVYAEGGNNAGKVILLKKAPAEIIIDGEIDNIWDNADSVSNFFQLQPYFGKEPSRHTLAKVLTTDEALYCLMVCYDKRELIQNITGNLDQTGGDIVSIMFDTFNDKRTAYKFAVSASGVRNDCRLLDDARNRDYSWDGIWFSDAKIYDWGYVVEMKIPYKSIQYDEKLSEWGLDFDRWIPRNSEDLYWCAYEENEGQRISKFGKLVFDNFQPSVKGLNLEIFPVAISKATYLGNNKYKIDPDAGIDVFYNPSQKLTYQLTVNPDFAQIEADPFAFNISRYEVYFSERRPFFTQGNEIFNPSGRENSSGFYRPLELFYPRRIGKLLPDGKEVPLTFGTKAFGRLGEWEYGGFVARTAEKEFMFDGQKQIEQQAYFGSARIKKQIFENSSIGVLFVGKHTKDNNYGVLDIDGAIRGSDWQFSYQVARSIKNNDGDFGGSLGFTQFKDSWMNLGRLRYIGNKFDINQVGYVPWIGTTQFTYLGGPRWYYETGYIRSILFYAGPGLYFEKADEYTDRSGILGFNMQFRDNWGYEINFSTGKSKDQGKEFTSYSANLSSWYNISPKWSANLYGGYERTYNFSRDYLAFYSWGGLFIEWYALDVLELGTSYDMYIEGNPSNSVEDITYNARPYFSLTPINNLNLRVYVDNVFVQSTEHLESIIIGLLFSYNFSPKSWIYFAFNEFKSRRELYSPSGSVISRKMDTIDRAGVFKIKYLYYF